MTTIVQFLMKHGYSVLFVVVFARQIGLPLPAPLFLLAAGALAATRCLALVPALVLATIACLIADWVWYEAGRQWGERVLRHIHRFAPRPEAADRRSKKIFARFGPQLLMVAKLVPGIDAVAPPLAGTNHISRLRFLAFDSVGAVLWSSAYAGIGYVFSQHLDRAAAYVAGFGTLSTATGVAGVCIYLVRKLVGLWFCARVSVSADHTTGSD